VTNAVGVGGILMGAVPLYLNRKSIFTRTDLGRV
jgi:hypothetical protein